LVVVAVFAVAAVAAQTCQQSQIRIDQQQAIARAEQQVSFDPTRTQVRLVRQGINSRPIWAVSLSVPDGAGGFSRLTVVEVDANTGKVEAVTNEVAP
jgi:hypothetical protein